MNLHGPVRAPLTAGSGDAKVTFSLAAWKQGGVAATTHTLAAVRSKFSGKAEPVSAALLASLVHPERTASIWGLSFNADGTRLFAAGYPSGVIQVFDVAKRRELRKIESPRGYRSSAEYALLTPDWKRLYVPAERRQVKTIEKDGKKAYRIEHSGEVRVWDVASGKEQPAIKVTDGHGPALAKLSPDGKTLVVVERPSFDTDDRKPERSVLVTLADGKRRELGEGFSIPVFSPDGKRIALSSHDYEAKASAVRLIDPATGKDLAKLDCPEKDRHFSVIGFSPDGGTLAVALGGKVGADLEVWFLDAKTLKRQSRYATKGDAEQYGWGSGGFTKDGKRYFLFRAGVVDLVDVATGKVARSVKCDWERPPWRWALSADGRYLAAGWMPPVDKDRERDREPDPRDLPQPRVSIIDLEQEAAPRLLIAPPGYVGGLAFSRDGKKLAFGGAGAVHLFDLTKK